MITGWNNLIVSAQPLIDFLSRDEFFQSEYSGIKHGRLVITDAVAAMAFTLDDSGDTFDDWETVTDSDGVFPDEFEWKRWITHNLDKNNYFDFSKKNFNRADLKFSRSGVCVIQELMHRDIKILLNCYANEFFPEIWKHILEVYLSGGFPCGWNGRYPAGELVVFSNI